MCGRTASGCWWRRIAGGRTRRRCMCLGWIKMARSPLPKTGLDERIRGLDADVGRKTPPSGDRMAQVHDLDTDRSHIITALTKSFQSGHSNFLLGAGASQPAIQLPGTLEIEIAALILANDIEGANKKIFELVSGIQAPT